MNKKDFLERDRILLAITEDGSHRIAIAKTTQVVKTAMERHQLSPLSAVLLGRTLTGCALLATNLKGEERVQLKLEGNGPVQALITEASKHGEVRGYTLNPAAEISLKEGENLADGLGVGVLSVSKILYNKAHPVTGTVELIRGSVSEDLAYYLLQSEQVPSAVSLDVSLDEHGNIAEAGGVLVQALPGADETVSKKLEDHIRTMPNICQLIEEGYLDRVLSKVTGTLPVKELARYPVDFFCRCSKDRFKSSLALISPDELSDMKSETEELVCHYCNEKYHFTKQEIDAIVQKAKIRQN
ncbi:Hsp33 family molecular chaperone HslO [Balneolaceae bacterium ANBcel3]|nr:Hsp33 family molecular chaperone HslO [Balneolaceae bacterium ANBcel3]